MLIDIPTVTEIKNNLKKLRNIGVPNFQYNLKHKDKFHWGPYAVLVKDTAFNANDLHQHDYLGMPEIIEDICNGYEAVSGHLKQARDGHFLEPKTSHLSY